MVTICVMPNLKGTRAEYCKALLVCLAIDMTYIIPILTTI